LAALGDYVRWVVKLEQYNSTMMQNAIQLSFPFGDFRAGQRDMSAAVYRACRDAHGLMCEAPTGIGKTISSLFPAIKCLGETHIRQVVYLTAKVAGRLSAMSALFQLQKSGLLLRSIEVSAKQSSCFCLNGRCDRDEQGRCPMTTGFYDRLPAARAELVDAGVIDSEQIGEIAWAHQLCPFELTQQLLPWMHVVVADYNYVFDPLVRLPYFSHSQKDTLLLIDEAHNLVDRSRQMYSALISRKQCLEEANALLPAYPLLAKELELLSAAMLSLARGQKEKEQVCELPGNTVNRVSNIVSLMVEAMSEPPCLTSQSSIDLFRALCRYSSIAELYGDNHRTITAIENTGRLKDVQINLFCLDASSSLSVQYVNYRSTVLFSASLSPALYFRDSLGLPATTQHLQLTSPFSSCNVYQAVVDWIETRYKARQSSLDSLVELIKDATSHKKGNYLVFFPSYTYLVQALRLFRERYPDIDTWAQDQYQSKSEQKKQLEQLGSTSHRIGFAILGGVFGEGVDYAGEMLIGVVIVGTGLPGIDSRTELIAHHHTQHGNDGFDYTYRFPGFVRVLQTAGRLIRDESDRGIILLVDARFSHRTYRQLYPAHWAPKWPRDRLTMNAQIEKFWHTDQNAQLQVRSSESCSD
nr:ATP-dependent DNA helicase [Granulosicoccus sp.]